MPEANVPNTTMNYKRNYLPEYVCSFGSTKLCTMNLANSVARNVIKTYCLIGEKEGLFLILELTFRFKVEKSRQSTKYPSVKLLIK